MKNNSYKGYSLFKDVENDLLRSFNRVVTLTNIKEDLGEGYVRGYLASIPETEYVRLNAVAARISQLGLEATRAEVNRACQS